MLDRKSFHAIMSASMRQFAEYNLRMLRQIEILKDLPEQVLSKMSDLIVVVSLVNMSMGFGKGRSESVRFLDRRVIIISRRNSFEAIPTFSAKASQATSFT